MIIKTHVDRATEDPRWKKSTPKQAQEILKEYKENAWWYDYDEWAHSGLDDPHKEN